MGSGSSRVVCVQYLESHNDGRVTNNLTKDLDHCPSPWEIPAKKLVVSHCCWLERLNPQIWYATSHACGFRISYALRLS
jgi:hypothetical protein